MRRMSLLLVAISSLFNINAQNLVPNHSFEDTLRRRTSLYLPTDWTVPNSASPEYLTPYNDSTGSFPAFAPKNYNGYQVAVDGLAYMGLRINSKVDLITREYVQVKLKQSLVKDSTYCFQIFVSLGDSMHYASKDQLGVHFSRNAITTRSMGAMPYIPQLIVSPNTYIDEKVNWIQFDLSYTANGRKDYITIGNFKDSSSMDTNYVGNGGNKPDYFGSYYYIDNIFLGDCDSVPNKSTGLSSLNLISTPRLFPNPTDAKLMLEWQHESLPGLRIWNSIGAVYMSKPILSGGFIELDVSDLSQGIYFLEIELKNQKQVLKFIKQE